MLPTEPRLRPDSSDDGRAYPAPELAVEVPRRVDAGRVVTALVGILVFAFTVGGTWMLSQSRLDAAERRVTTLEQESRDNAKETAETEKQLAVIANELKSMNERLGNLDAKVEKIADRQANGKR